MGDPFGGEEHQGDDGESDLEALRIEFFPGDRLHAPLSGGVTAQAAHFCNDVEIDQSSEEREDHHWDTDGVLVEATCRRVDAGGSG